jgi:DNA-binding transcriptional LysR family regulator
VLPDDAGCGKYHPDLMQNRWQGPAVIRTLPQGCTMTPSPAVLHQRLLAGSRLRHLQVFAAIAELGSAQRAANALGLTQPGATQLVADLERLLECALFLRHARGMRLTEIGRELEPFVRRALAALEGGAECVALRREHTHGIVRVGAMVGAVCGLLVRALPPFGRTRPDILVELHEVDMPELNRHITQGDLDLLLCRAPAVLPQGMEFVDILPDRMVVVAGPTHPMAGVPALDFAALAEQTWLRLPSATHAAQVLEERMARLGKRPRYGPLLTRSHPMAQALLRSEHLLMLAPHSVVRQQVESGQLVILDVRDGPDLQHIGVLYAPASIGVAAQELMEHLQQFGRRFP